MKLFFTILNNLEKKERLKAYGVFLLIFTTLVLDFLGIGLILPIISLIVKEDFYLQVNKIAFFNDWNKEEIIIFFLIFIVFIFFIKNTLYLFFNYFKKKLLAEVNISFSSRVFNSYISDTYTSYLKKGEASMIRDISLVGDYTKNIELFINIMIEILILVFVSIIAIYTNYKLAIFIMLLSIIAYFIFNRLFAKRLIHYGKLANIYDQNTTDNYLNTFGSIKELILQRKQKFFENKYSQIFFKNAMAQVKSSFVIETPRNIIEFGVVVIISLVIFIFLRDSANIDDFLVQLAIFITLVFRAMPSISKLIYQSNSINLKLDLLNRVNKIIINASNSHQQNDFKNKKVEKFDFENINFQNVSYEYEKNKKIISDVNFQINKNDTIGIIGSSGSGKSTLIDLISGLLKPTEGKILINDKNNYEEGYIFGLQEKIAYISQHNFLLNDSIKNNIAFGIEEKDINLKNLENAIARAQLKNFVDSCNDNYNFIVGHNGKNLSGGQRQRIILARALYKKVDILLLDEATSALDGKTENQIFKDIKDNFHNKKTLIISTHNEKLLNFCNNIYKIKSKKIIKIK
jgi:ATP-binding cassette, subfamily B, bacterial PglK